MHDLEQAGLIKRVPPSRGEALEQLALGRRDLRVALNTLVTDADWAFAIAYDAGLHACLSLMVADGWRPRAFDRHRTAIQYALMSVPGLEPELLALDSIRQKRHRVIYERAGLVGPSEAREVVRLAEALLDAVAGRLGELEA